LHCHITFGFCLTNLHFQSSIRLGRIPNKLTHVSTVHLPVLVRKILITSNKPIPKHILLGTVVLLQAGCCFNRPINSIKRLKDDSVSDLGQNAATTRTTHRDKVGQKHSNGCVGF